MTEPSTTSTPAAVRSVDDPRSALAGLRPRALSGGNPNRVEDPIVEPLWAGIRVLAAVDDDGATLVDEAGAVVDDHPLVGQALVDSRLAEAIVLDGFLTRLSGRDGSAVYTPLDDLPSASQMASRPLLGIRRTRAEDVARELQAARSARTFGPDDVVTFVAIDLLWLDGESLLDVPLLERRRLLDSALGEADLVRRGAYVRPPLDAWIGSWRSIGFTGISYKAANGRYQAGSSPDWISMPMPRR